MRLLYLANNRIPSEKANSLQIMQMCRAFRLRGAEVELVVPHRVQPRMMRAASDPFLYYGIQDRFPIAWLPCVDALEAAPASLQHPAFALQSATFALALAWHLARATAVGKPPSEDARGPAGGSLLDLPSRGGLPSRGTTLYYSRDPLSTILLALSPTSVRARSVYEAHTFPGPGHRRRLHLWAVGRIGHLVCITQGLAREYSSRGIPEGRILVAPDAVDSDSFSAMPDRDDARRSLGIPLESTVACYTGHLYRWKGVHTLALASALLPPGHLVYIVGGTEEDQAGLRRFVAERGLAAVRLVGQVAPDRVVPYLAAADVLVLPNSGADLRSSRYTSPMKLFEYMAARRPIVASRLPSLQEVLRDGENALLVAADDPVDLATGIVRAASSPSLASRLAGQAWQEVQGRSWVARAGAILDFVGGSVRHELVPDG